jgi:hypothetical protein
MIKNKRSGLLFVLILIGLFSLPCFADVIVFQNHEGSQTGVVVGEDDQSITIRFPKAAIKSVKKSDGESSNTISGKVIWEERKDYLILKIPRSSIRTVQQKTGSSAPSVKQESVSTEYSQKNESTVRPEKPPEKIGKGGTKHIAGPPVNISAHQELLKEEMGSIEGVILWQGKPLRNRPVKIVLERYTGFSPAALEKWFAAEKGTSLQDGIILGTRTDSLGHYIFHEVPPGYYRLYWMPDANTGWIRRLREKPDIDVTTGNLSIGNVPEKLK